ncbi:hypothetical protein BH20ACT18_BH20ACT18_02690 [soil metagenome]
MTCRRTRLAATGLPAAGCLGLVAACGDDDDGADAKTTAACKADIAIDQGFNMLFEQTPALQGDKPPTKAQLPKVQANYDKFAAAPVAEFEKNAPEEIAGDTEKLVAAAKKFRATGDASQFESPAFMTAGANVDTYLYDNCDDEKTEVKAPDYKFEGLEDSYPAGVRRFKLDNTGKEAHEMIILRRKAGVTESYDEILKLPEEKAQTKVDFVGGVDPIDPGKAGYGSGDFTAGEYLAVCFLPKGTTTLKKEGKGPPHFTLGMKEEFKVE